MPKKLRVPKKGRIKVGTRVQLNKEPPGVTTDGTVISTSGKKASWNVEWRHKIPFETLVQSSKSLRLWRLDLTQVELSSDDGTGRMRKTKTQVPRKRSLHLRPAMPRNRRRKGSLKSSPKNKRAKNSWYGTFFILFYFIFCSLALLVGGRQVVWAIGLENQAAGILQTGPLRRDSRPARC